jgi:hypothetical protein
MALVNALKTAKKYLHKFIETNNRNTGNIYEIHVTLSILRKMGLTDEHLLTLSPDLETLERLGKGNSGISGVINHVKKTSVSNNLIFEGKKVIDILNLTQEDGVGTSDLSLVFEDSTSFGISITEGTGKINATSGIKKVITNASVTRMGCTSEDINEIIELEKKLSPKDKDLYCIEKFGTDDKTKWKKCKYPAGIQVQSDAATVIRNRLNSLPDDRKRAIANDILCLTTKPADYFAFVNKKTFAVTYYKINDTILAKDTWVPRFEVSGQFIHTFCGDILISESQVKYNCYVGDSMRKVNVGAVLNKLFDLRLINDSAFKSS